MTLCNATYEDLLEAKLGIFDMCPDHTCGQKVNRHRVRVGPGMFSKETHAYHFPTLSNSHYLFLPCFQTAGVGNDSVRNILADFALCVSFLSRFWSMNEQPSCFLFFLDCFDSLCRVFQT